MVYKFFGKKFPGANTSGGAVIQNQELAEELNKRISGKLEKMKVHSSFKQNFWGADLAYMQLISKYNK